MPRTPGDVNFAKWGRLKKQSLKSAPNVWLPIIPGRLTILLFNWFAPDTADKHS